MKEAQAVSSGDMVQRQAKASGMPPLPAVLQGPETACEHIGNAQQLVAALYDLLKAKDLRALASDVAAIGARLERARAAIAAGNLGRP